MMNEFGCCCEGKTAFGEKNGYPYTVELVRGGETPELHMRFVVDGAAKPAAARLRGEKMPHLHWVAEADEAGGVLVGVCLPPSDFYAKSEVHSMLRVAPLALRAAGLGAPAACPLCGLENCDCHALLDDGYRATHMECLKTRLELPAEDRKIPAHAGGNVFLGILGALFGAFVAALPIWSLALSRDTVFWVLYAFIPFISGLCYRMFRGKANVNVAALSVLGASLLAALCLEQVWYWMVLSAQYGATLPMSFTVGQYFATHSFAGALKEMLFCLIALVVGFVAVSVVLRRYVAEAVVPAHIVRGAAYVIDTAMPIEPAAPKEAEDPPESEGGSAQEPPGHQDGAGADAETEDEER